MNISVIDTLNVCFMVCMAFAILFFIISVVLFFVFDIKTIFNIRTGRAQAKTIKEMKAANESTGRLRIDGKTQTSRLTEDQKDIERVPAVVSPDQQIYKTQTQMGSEETEVLASEDNTVVLKPDTSNFAETTVLSGSITQNFDDSDDVAQIKSKINFVLTKKEVYVHTTETI